MSKDYRFGDDVFQSDQGFGNYKEPKQRSMASTCLIGCGILAIVFLIVVVVGGIFVARNFRGWATSAVSQALHKAVDESHLPDDQKAVFNEQVDRLAKAVRNGEITVEEVGNFLMSLSESPILASFVIFQLDDAIEKSTLSDEDKEQGRRTLQRFTRGWVEKSIPESDLDKALHHVGDLNINSETKTWRLRPILSDADLQAFFKDAQAAADAANVPDEPFFYNPAGELKRMIDKALKVEGDPPADDVVPDLPEKPEPEPETEPEPNSDPQPNTGSGLGNQP